jgi:hypothetical protein
MNTPPKIYVALPHSYGFAEITVRSLCALMDARCLPPGHIHLAWSSDPCLMRARNELSAAFLESDCDKLLFIDSDIGFTVENFQRIIAHDQAIVGGLYPLKRMRKKVEWCANRLVAPRVQPPPQPDGLQEIRYLGTGFLCIAREVFEKMRAVDRAEIEYTNEEPPHRVRWDFWRQGVRRTDDPHPRYLTEDFFFCQRWLELGGKVFMDTRVVLRHVGHAVWPLDLQENNPLNPQPQVKS